MLPQIVLIRALFLSMIEKTKTEVEKKHLVETEAFTKQNLGKVKLRKQVEADMIIEDKFAQELTTELNGVFDNDLKSDDLISLVDMRLEAL